MDFTVKESHTFRYGLIFGVVILLALCVNVIHPYLWGPDEPREAEIAREAFLSGEYAYSTFNRIPFVEKPPLYYDVAAGAFALAGGTFPGAARMVSALLGVLMAGAVFLIARHKMGVFYAAAATALLVSMPQFYRATHWILVDVGVGAFVTAALAIYGYWVLHPEKRESNGMLTLFYLAAAAAFLTKGMVTLVYLGIVIVPFMIYKRKWLPFRLNWTLLFFLVPVAGWIWLFYQKGGIYFLHEHFINNIFGRLLHREFCLPGSPVTVSDVGHDTRWSFYFERIPAMFGAALVFLPVTLVAVIRSLQSKAKSVVGVPATWYGKLLQKMFAPFPEVERDWVVYLAIWTFFPFLAFSIPAIKEVTYLLPSYAGLALLAAAYLKHLLPEQSTDDKRALAAFAVPVVLTALFTQFLAPLATTAALGIVIVILAGCAAAAIAAIYKRRWRTLTMAVLAALVSGVILGNTPPLMLRTRLARKCYREVAIDVSQYVGARELYIYGGDESIRGALPFYGSRNLTVLTDGNRLLELTLDLSGKALVMKIEHYDNLLNSGEVWHAQLSRLTSYRPDCSGKADEFVVLTAPETPEK